MPSMARFGRAKKPPKPEEADDDAHANRHLLLPAPRVNLLHIEPQLNMHQYNEIPIPPPSSTHPNGKTTTHPTNGDDDHHSKSPPNNDGSEWSSAVGHAATGKSGRVIHNLQEEIARLTRECGVYRSRAEETQRMNEAYKTQVQNMTERLGNLEQANETNLQSIARKDKKMDELRGELKTERDRRVQADADKAKATQLMGEARDDFHRESAELREIASHARSQYEVLAAQGQRDRGEQTKRLGVVREEIAALKRRQEEKGPVLGRLEEIAAEKDGEIERAKGRFEALFKEYERYREAHDGEVARLVEKARSADQRVDAVLAELRDTEGRMKWVMRVKDEVKDAE
ncbi:hypothetical protein FE257_007892 [Aspergillus nanangensis]|uniref:SWI5-dependent HO expression protein 3 n=1 Tax=Aspergillus nanangensis TaxID=2582783 RepID=A0AAD4GY03_ASPNN|nr:hypothetical protein FE257_007892 [Aspergillus nanangensis]